MASTSIYKTMVTATNRNIFTLSMWVKMAKTGSDLSAYQFCDFYVSGSIRISLYHDPNDHLNCFMQGGGYDNNIFVTNAKYRDTSAWYHFVWRFDTTQATASDRVRLYVNGELATFSSTNYPSQNFNLQQGTSSYTQYIGRYGGNTNNNFEGLMSHIHFCDGYSYDASSFGETDSTTGEWKIKTSPSVTYGNNGFFILKDGNSVTDHSGNNLSFSTGGTLTKTEDCPSNVFATLNPLVPDAGSLTYSAGNTKQWVDTANWRSSFSTLGMTTGKYYFEVLKNAGSNTMIGVRGVEQSDGSLSGSGNDWVGAVSTGWSLYNVDGVVKNNNSDVGSAIGTYANDDIIGCFLDCDNSKLYFSKNGTMLNTTGKSITAGLTYMFGVSGHTTARLNCNFGNGYYDTTAVSTNSGNGYAGSDGNGIFSYSPNNITLDGSSKSFKALSTKGLNT